MERILIGDIPEEVCDQVSDPLLKYAVGLVGGAEKAPAHEFDLVGSGTFVRAGDKHAILTADHVLGCLQGREPRCTSAGALGLVFPKRRLVERRPIITPMHELHDRMMTIARHSSLTWGIGPDMGVILLTASEVELIKEERSFYDLEDGNIRITNSDEARSGGLRLAYGFRGEETRWETAADDFYLPNFSHAAYWGGTEVEKEQVDEGLDYFSIDIGEREAGELPRTISGQTSLAGLSGGGVWYVQLIKNGQFRPDLMVSTAILRGITFGSMRLAEEDRILQLSCHGWRSIYDKVLSFLKG